MSGSGRRWKLLLVLGVLGAFGPLSIDTYLPALPRIAGQLQAGSSLVQLSITASLLGLGLGQLVWGPASDRHGRRPVVLIGLAGFAASSALCALTPSVEVLILLRLVQGASGSAGIVVSRAIVRDLYSGREMSRVFSRMLLVTGTAPVVAPILGAQILRFSDWRTIFWVLAAIGVATLGATAIVVGETLAPQNRTAHTMRQDLRRFREIIHNRSFTPYMLSVGLFGGVLFAFISGSPFVVENIYRQSPTAFSLVFACVSAAMILLGQVNARLVRSHSPQSLLAVAVSTSAFGGLVILLIATVGISAGLPAFVVGLIFAVSPNGAIQPNATALGLQHYAVSAGAASALLGLSTFLGGAATSPLVGVAGEGTAIPQGIVMATCAVLGVLILPVIRRDHKSARESLKMDALPATAGGREADLEVEGTPAVRR
jgi:MFS transporter, DHA1 family, multidrug resistance protein